MTDRKKLQSEKDALMKEYFEVGNVVKIMEKKVKHLEGKKFSEPVLAILRRDVARLKGAKKSYRGRVAHLTYLQVHSGRRK